MLLLQVMLDLCEGDDCIDWIPGVIETGSWEKAFNRLGFDIKIQASHNIEDLEFCR